MKVTSFCVIIIITVFFRVLKVKLSLVILTFQTAVCSHQVMGVISKSLRYGKYTTLNMVLFLQLIGLKQKEKSGSWAKATLSCYVASQYFQELMGTFLNTNIGY